MAIIVRKIILIIILFLIFSIPAFAQTFKIDSYKSNYFQNPQVKSDTVNYKPLFTPIELGLGFGSDKYNEYSYGTIFFIDFLSFTYRTNSYNGFGIGTKAFEFSQNFGISFFPIYFHYPVHEKIKTIKDKNNKVSLIRSPYVYCFAGGSPWKSYDNYFQIGIDASIYIMKYTKIGFYMNILDVIADTLLKAFPVMSIGIRSGLVYNPGYNTDYGNQTGSNIGFYIGLKLCSGNGF